MVGMESSANVVIWKAPNSPTSIKIFSKFVASSLILKSNQQLLSLFCSDTIESLWHEINQIVQWIFGIYSIASKRASQRPTQMEVDEISTRSFIFYVTRRSDSKVRIRTREKYTHIVATDEVKNTYNAQ